MSSLSPIDLLSLSPTEQHVLRCLTKYPQSTVFEVVENTELPPTEVEEILHSLLKQTKIVEQLQQGKRVFSARFQFKHKRVRNMPDEILNLLDQSPKQFLEETAPTDVLSPEDITRLIALSQERTLLPGEVLAWQGQKLNSVAVIQEGLLTSIRLKGKHVGQKKKYLHSGTWLGLTEALNEAELAATYTAVTNATLLVWPIDELMEFIRQHSLFAVAIARWLGQQLGECEKLKTQGMSKLWAVEGTHPHAGVTTFATNLAWLTQQQIEQSKPRVLFWPVVKGRLPQWLQPVSPENQNQESVGLAKIVSTLSGLDVLTQIEPNSYSLQVQLDVLLADLHTRYETIICDTGSEIQDELLLRLRGRAHTLLTLTQDSAGAEKGMQRWQHLQPYAIPEQKRVLTLNKAGFSAAQVSPQFHLLIPKDERGLATNMTSEQCTVGLNPHTPFVEALQEVYRRLSLNHSVALFVPSTMDVNQQTDNRSQVQATLSFLGNLFGGATSSNAEGAWRSEESGLVQEQVTIVRTFVSKKALDTYLDDVVNFAADLKNNMKQEAVAISVDNQLILV